MMEVTTLVTPTQCVVIRLASNDWGTAVRAVAYIPATAFSDEVELDPLTNGFVLKIGQFRVGAELTITIELKDEDDIVTESQEAEIVVTAGKSPAVVARQAVFDALEADGIADVFLLTDGYRRPASAAEDMPFVGGNVVIEVGAPSSRKKKKTQVRSEVTCELPISVYVFGEATSDAFITADNATWDMQRAIDDTKNLRMVGLANIATNDFTWDWDVQAPEVVEVQGSPMPVVIQQSTLTIPIIWVSAPAS
jgi:hypothetical protein